MRTSATLLLLLGATISNAQTPGDTLTMAFDIPGEELVLDSVYPLGCWQVGTPTKPVFTSAYSPGRALVTDTILPHPSSMTCYAEFTLITTDLEYLGRSIEFRYFRDMDTTARGWVEAFDPFQLTWHRFGTSWDEYYQVGDVVTTALGPEFVGQDTSWQYAWLESPCGGVLQREARHDRMWYDPIMRVRFVFESQGNPDGHDGWMIDDVRASVSYCSGSVREGSIGTPTVYPVPTSGSLWIDPRTNSEYVLDLLGPDGKVVAPSARITDGIATINVSDLAAGIYAARVTAEGSTTTHRFVVER